MTSFPVIDPATGEQVDEHAGHSRAEVDAALDDATRAQSSWKRVSFSARAEVLRNAAGLLRERKDALAERMAVEMGKPLAQGRAEAEKCAWVCEHYAEEAAAYLSGRPIDTDARRSRVAYRPLGVVLAVMPWNYPLWQVFRFAAPALMAGNAGILKHASNVPGCALDIEAILHDAGLPPELFRSLLVHHDEVPHILDHPGVVAATLTGSERAGRSIAAEAGKRLLPTVLELGGSDPYVILEDADIEAAAEACAAGRLLNSGQSCIAAKRMIAVDEVYDAFLEAFVAAMRRRTLGDPRAEGTDIGPQARADLRDALHRQVEATVDAGARCVLGGEIPDRPGAWYPATVLSDVPEDAPGAREEVFGPAASLFRARDEADALRLANDTPFGLGAAVFTEDLARGERIATEELDAGCCFVNSFVKSDPRLPFGGIGISGYGRELSAEGIRAFVNAKTVYVA
ncbi:MAG: NAD-dependent succinate-semialdehyde dehydrogenase [Deltaproteobacteria bacterium]|nr:MAG: NAD-dependent succinate-semialdehyde dehydrogenase [Deltaproteobacteria bacterium]